jgi:hypothetical protein
MNVIPTSAAASTQAAGRPDRPARIEIQLGWVDEINVPAGTQRFDKIIQTYVIEPGARKPFVSTTLHPGGSSQTVSSRLLTPQQRQLLSRVYETVGRLGPEAEGPSIKVPFHVRPLSFTLPDGQPAVLDGPRHGPMLLDSSAYVSVGRMQVDVTGLDGSTRTYTSLLPFTVNTRAAREAEAALHDLPADGKQKVGFMDALIAVGALERAA